jgi:hypothetical protein
MRNTEDNTKAAVAVSGASAHSSCHEAVLLARRHIYGSVVQPHGGGDPVMGQFTVVGTLAW